MHDLIEVESWLNQAHSRESSNDYDDVRLDPLKSVLQLLPPIERPITIAGTKGKGSIQCFLEAIILAHQRQTVCFTSPHVASITERWRINGREVSESELVLVARAVAVVERESDESLTYFERCFAIAVVLASRYPQATFLVEVGLGGRLDCANALDARIALLGHLGYDHTDVLGNTLEAIATEKLAICRPDAPCIIGPQTADAAQALSTISINALTVEQPGPCPSEFTLGLLGDHQRGNAGVAWRAAQWILADEFNDHHAKHGLADAQIQARCQLISWHDRPFIIDSAHHDHSLAASIATAEQHFDGPWVLIFGCAKDKELERMAAIIPEGLQVMRCGFIGQRACMDEDFPSCWQHYPWFFDIAEALDALPRGYSALIAGSFYLAGEALDLIGD